MRVVLDTNVLVSAFTTPEGVGGHILDAWQRNAFTLIISPYILIELQRILVRKIGLSTAFVDEKLREFYSLAFIVEPLSVFVDGIDADDMPIVGTALAGSANYLVTGDRKFLALRLHETIKLITPRAFLAMV